MEFKTTPLFGGAIVADLPSAFQDVSEIREVPDTQEVYLSQKGYTSIVFDILERVTEPEGDLEALKFHLSDIIDEEDSEKVRIVEDGREVSLAKLPNIKALAIHASAPPSEKQRGRAHEPSSVELLVLLVRLEEVQTDVVVTVNVPCGISDDAATNGRPAGEMMEEGKEILERVRGSLEVRDWGLFSG